MNENFDECMKELVELSNQKRVITSKCQQTSTKLLRLTEPDDLKEFYRRVELLRVHLWRRPLRSTWDLERALHSFWSELRKETYGKNWSLEEEGILFYRFVKRWGMEVDAASAAFEKLTMSGYRGDDSWSDLIDAAPLLGHRIMSSLKLENVVYETEEEVTNDFRTHCVLMQRATPYESELTEVAKNADHMVNAVFHGENYLYSEMQDFALKAFGWTAHKLEDE